MYTIRHDMPIHRKRRGQIRYGLQSANGVKKDPTKMISNEHVDAFFSNHRLV